MGQTKKDPEDQLTYSSIGFTPRDLRIIAKTMRDLGVSKGAAVRILVRRGASGPATSPFTPIEGIDDQDE